MPVQCRVVGNKHRIVEPSGRVAKTKKGNPVDGGGHSSRSACNRQARAINRSINQSDIGRKPKMLSRILDSLRMLSGRTNLSYYDAAKDSKLNKDWRPGLASADQAILDDLDSLMARSRSMVRNDGVSDSGRKAYLRYVIGSGITARSAARHPVTGEMLENYNENLDRIWNAWANNPTLCDVEKTKLFTEKQALWLSEEFVVGGVFVVLGYRPNAEGVGLVLQEIEYEQADTTIQSYGERDVRSGVEVDEYGAPIAYHLYTTSHPSEEYRTESGRVPAERVIHIFRQDRIRQKRGVPWLSAVMPSIRNLAMYEQFMMMKARTEAAYHGIVEQEATGGFGLPENVARQIGAVPPSTEAVSTDTSANNIEVLIQPGLMPVLNPGQSIKFPTPATPNTMYQPFVMEQLKRISAGIGLDLATVARWYAEGNFSSQRQAKLELYAETDPLQKLYIHKVLTRIRNEFIEIAIKEGRLKATGYSNSPRWKDAYRTTNWQGPPKPSIDAFKDAVAARELMNLGLLSPQQYFNERGMEIRDVYAELEEAKKLRKKHGLEIDETKVPVKRNGQPRGKDKDENNGKGNGKFSTRFSDRMSL